METVGPQKKILRPDQVYSREKIQKRMAKSFGQAGPLMESILSSCAEVAERMMYELVSAREPVITLQRYNWDPGRFYVCPACGKHKIKTQHCYCPNCGHKINWIS